MMILLMVLTFYFATDFTTPVLAALVNALGNDLFTTPLSSLQGSLRSRYPRLTPQALQFRIFVDFEAAAQGPNRAFISFFSMKS